MTDDSNTDFSKLQARLERHAATHSPRDPTHQRVARFVCFHTTNAAEAILRDGFRDATGSYGFVNDRTGVWVGDRPMDINEGAKGDQVLKVELPDGVDLGGFEVIEDGKPYREWCVPAALINAHATVTLMSDEELERMGSNIYRGYLDPPPWLKRDNGFR